MHINNDNFESWKRKRKYTFVIFYITTAIIGTEYAIVMPTLLNYLTNVIKCEHEEIWFGAIVSCYWLSSFLGSLTITRYADKTRDIRLCTLIVILVAAVGNLLYTVPYSPVFLLIGRIFQGFGDSLISVFTGEIARVYHKDEVLSRISILISSYYLTFILGPAANVIFSKVEFNIFGIPFTVANFPNLLVGFCWLSCFVPVFFVVTNLSKEYDLKSEITSNPDENNEKTELILMNGSGGKDTYGTVTNNNNVPVLFNKNPMNDQQTSLFESESDQRFDQSATTNRISSDKISSMKTSFQQMIPFKKLIQSRQFRFIMILNFICAYISVAFFDIGLPFVGTNLYKVSTEILAALFSVTGLAFLMTLYFLSKGTCNKSEVYLITSGLSLLVAALQCLVFAILFHDHRTLGITFLVGYALSLGIGWSVEQVLLASLLSQLIPSSTQTYAEGIRRAISSIAYVGAGIVTPLLYRYLVHQAFFFSISIFISIFYLWRHRDEFFDIRMLRL